MHSASETYQVHGNYLLHVVMLSLVFFGSAFTHVMYIHIKFVAHVVFYDFEKLCLNYFVSNLSQFLHIALRHVYAFGFVTHEYLIS